MIRTVLGFLLLTAALHADIQDNLLSGLEDEGVTVDFLNPTFSEGVLSTSEGGVLNAPLLRIQAKNICYDQKSVTASEQLIVSFGVYVFVGDSIEYDFETKEGVIYGGKSAIEPWYFGGEKIYLHGEECVQIEKGFLTTSEKSMPDWQIRVQSAKIYRDHSFVADSVRFQIFQLPVFWVPTLKANLNWIFDSPLRYRVRWGGQQGLRVGMIYEALNWHHLQAFLRFDYRIRRGPGGGVETLYVSPYKNHTFQTINYIADDSSIDDPSLITRYRFQGLYHNEWDRGYTSVDLSYDYLSDKEMPTDYDDEGLNIETAERTQFNLRRQQDELCVANFFTRVRINEFQTVKQELPSIKTLFKPFLLSNTGIFSDNRFDLGYFDFKYDQDDPTSIDYHATRLQFFNRIYRPTKLGAFFCTPFAEGVAILYGSGPTSNTEWLAVGTFGCEIKSDFFRFYGPFKHIVEPYTKYEVITAPTIPPDNHFMFDISDGWYRMNALRTGLRQLIYYKPCGGVVSPYVQTDLFTYTFFDTPTINEATPRLFFDAVWHPTYRIKETLNTAWDFERNAIYYLNLRSDVTVSDDIAFSVEYRQRSSFAWRKAEYYNYILDSFHTEQELRNSLVSDQRNTFLTHFFYRFDPSLATEVTVRQGWNRLNEPSYTEYAVDLIFLLRASWQMRLSIQKNEGEGRVTLYFNLVGERP